MKTTVVVGIAGGTGSGKTELARRLLEDLPAGSTLLLSHDSYYRDLSHLSLDERARSNFDDPAALETELLIEHLQALRSGATIDVPDYDFGSHTRRPAAATRAAPHPVVLVEGILVLALTGLRDALDLRVFVDTAADLRLARRIDRDVRERGRSVDSVLTQYLTTTRPMHNLHVEPSRDHADLIVPGDRDTTAGRRTLAAFARRAAGI